MPVRDFRHATYLRADVRERMLSLMNATQQAAFEKLTTVENRLRFAWRQEERESLAAEWRRLRAIIDG